MTQPLSCIMDTQNTPKISDMFTIQKAGVRTRFAPSPTGHLHVGGVRTAIFNWAWARKRGGKFYLRVDDTDHERHVDGAVEKILDGFKWLGLDWDAADVLQGHGGHVKPASEPTGIQQNGVWTETESGLVYQSLRGFAYMDAVSKMKEYTYPCFCTKEETQALQSQCRKEGKRFSCSCRDLKKTNRPWNKSFCTRLDVLKVQSRGDIVVDDLILGTVSRNVNDISDPIIMRTQGGTIYSLACTVDDYEMGISHVIRGQEHLTNTFVQMLYYHALGWRPPKFAHVPFICAPQSTKKLSKRNALDLGIPITLEQYQDAGYLPDSLFNYLSHLGWSMDATTEKWTREEFVDAFDFKGTVKKPAQYDLGKCLWLNSEYMKGLSLSDRVALTRDFLQRSDNPPADEYLAQIVDAAGDRLTTASDIEQYRHFWEESEYCLDPKAVQKRLLKNDAYKKLSEFQGHLENCDWNAQDIQNKLQLHSAAHDIKPALLIHALRTATTGKLIGFGVFEGMEILGRERCLNRIILALEHCALQQEKMG